MNDLDMSAVSWNPLPKFNKTFDGNGHTIRIKIDGATDNYQGLFKEIGSEGVVKNLKLEGNIHCSESRLVGGICGQNDGKIENCCVSADVSSDWHDSGAAVTGQVGGICGENNGTVQYCCMTGNVANNDADVGGLVGDNSGATVKHCTFYGSVSSTHSQDNQYVGDAGSEEDLHDTYSEEHYTSVSNQSVYSYAHKYPYKIDVSTVGNGTVEVSAGSETGLKGWHPDETITLKQMSGTIARLNITDADGNPVQLQGQAQDGSIYWFVMPHRNVTASVVFYADDWPAQGTGTSDDPYIISSSDDWDKFAYNVTYGRSYSGKVVKLNTDISVTTMAGGYQDDDNYQPFSGTFDGGGYTLTINVSNQSRFAAPFKCVSGATIKNLHTTGTIDGTDNSDGKLLAGIIGVSFGNTTITGCRSSMTLTTNFGEDAAMAGLVAGTKGGSLTIEGCVFDGEMLGTTNTRCAGISGYEYTATNTTISYTLFTPKTLTVSTTDSYTKTFSRDEDAILIYCFYTKVLGTTLGAQAIVTSTAPSSFGNLVKDYGLVKVHEKGLLYNGKYYFAYSNCQGTGEKDDPYIISNEDEWLSFWATVTNNGINYSGKFIQLEADINITVSAPVGSRANNKPFSGTFLGNGHTITVALTDDGNQGLAPFRYIKGATIKDLKVAGTIASSQYHTSGLVGFAEGTNLIESCLVNATLNINSDYAGGIIGHGLTSTTTIKGCVFAGTIYGRMSSRGSLHIGGIWGWNNDNATPNLEGCLEKGTYTNISSMHPIGLQSDKGTITGCYYVNAQIGSPKNVCTVSGAKQAITFTTAPAILGNLVQDYDMVKVYDNGILFDGIYYVVPATFAGSGTEEDPYLIKNTYEWDTFAKYINNGDNYRYKYVKLDADIAVTTMAGDPSENHPFMGHFDGGGHKLTFTMGTAESPFDEKYCAPFRYTSYATIKNLKVAGDIYTSQMFAAGLISYSYYTYIINCQVGTVIHSSVEGDGSHGGLVADPAAYFLSIDGCAYTGRLLTNKGTNNCGGFVAWYKSATISVINSLYAPAGDIPSGWSAINNGATFVLGGSPTITNCYYTETMGDAQGKQAYTTATTPANLGSEVQDYGTLKAYENGILYDGTYYAVPATISLANAVDNSTTISNADRYLANVTLAGRTLYKDGDWNTLTLPFDVALDGSPLKGATARTLTEASISGTTLNLTFGDAVTTLQAGTPYIIKWESGNNLVNPVFHGVTIDKTERNYDNDVSGDKRVRFLGTYKSTTFGSEDKSILLVGGSNTLYWPQSGASIGAQRAYFKLGEDGAYGARITSFNIGFGDDDNTTTGIIEAEANSSLYPLPSTVADGWYDLQGRKIDNDKLSNGKMPRGVYIRGGRKVVVK